MLLILQLLGRHWLTDSSAAMGTRTSPVATQGLPLGSGDSSAGGHLGGRVLSFPVPAVSWMSTSDSFADARGARAHLAMDILAPRGSDVVAADDGAIARLSNSTAGGLGVYQLDAAQRYCYFYAHLNGYALGLFEGQPVQKGQVLGYVGTTGNAPPNTPHLHFAIYELVGTKECAKGRPVNPYPLWR